MITQTFDSYWIPFIQSQNYDVQGYNYKSMNLKDTKRMPKVTLTTTLVWHLKALVLKIGLSNAKNVQIIYWFTNWNSKAFIQEYAFENVICKM